MGDSKSARNSTANRSKIPPTGVHAGNTLTDWITLLPTPTAHEPGGSVEQYRARLAAHDGRESTFTPLSMLAPTLLPTPRTSDTNGAGKHGTGGLDLRTAIGDLTAPRSPDGNEPSVDPPHLPSMTEAG